MNTISLWPVILSRNLGNASKIFQFLRKRNVCGRDQLERETAWEDLAVSVFLPDPLSNSNKLHVDPSAPPTSLLDSSAELIDIDIDWLWLSGIWCRCEEDEESVFTADFWIAFIGIWTIWPPVLSSGTYRATFSPSMSVSWKIGHFWKRISQMKSIRRSSAQRSCAVASPTSPAPTSALFGIEERILWIWKNLKKNVNVLCWKLTSATDCDTVSFYNFPSSRQWTGWIQK